MNSKTNTKIGEINEIQQSNADINSWREPKKAKLLQATG